ncbi:MAG: short-chain dehydrogenase/reductase [Gammaproteobacteria bacterium]|jgi:NAD(P)-dependent dehydrogenase (short-subunit alcohol dehydrogenase family)|nr:short-chain dehydrogenase/reductase [Gammaproteobacteria bacterium]
MRLKSKVIVITGGGGGMGRAIATLFAAEGAQLVLGEWNEESLASALAEIRQHGGTATGLCGNVAVQAEAERLVEAAVSEYGRVDVLVNNAGVLDVNQGVGELSDAVWERVIGINLNGPMYTSRKAVQHMLRQGGGNIINIVSTAGVGGASAGAAYTVSKHGLVGLTRNTAWMYTHRNIRCNAICPAGVATQMAKGIDLSKVDPLGAERNGLYYGIMPRMLQPEEIAKLALYLASDDSACISGDIISADYGWRAA